MEAKQPSSSHLNAPVFYGSAVIILALVICSVAFQEHAQALFGDAQAWIIANVSWLYILAVALILLMVVLLAFSRYGDIKLGGSQRTGLQRLTWFAMLFSAGMGIGLMFFGVAEPVMHFLSPPVGEGGTTLAAREAMKITFFHWGLHAWSIYAIVAMILAYFAYRHGLPLTLRSALYPLIGERIYGPIGHAVDIFAIIGTVLGVATSLGLGVTQINTRLNHLYGLPVTIPVQIGLIVATTLLATISVVTGLNRGVRRLSELNLSLAGLLMLMVLIAGPTVFILQTFVQNIGSYLSDIVNKTFNLYAYEPNDWIGGWTLFYWGWWLAWSPFVGLFIARISRGRTIPRIRCRCAAGTHRLHPVVDDRVRRYRHPHDPLGAREQPRRGHRTRQLTGTVRLLRTFSVLGTDLPRGDHHGGGVLRHLRRLRRAGGGHARLRRQSRARRSGSASSGRCPWAGWPSRCCWPMA